MEPYYYNYLQTIKRANNFLMMFIDHYYCSHW